MSEHIPYDPDQLEILRSRPGLPGNIEISMASFTLNQSYSEDELGTLIFESSTASLVMSYWDDIPADPPVKPDDTFTVHYGIDPNRQTLFRGMCRTARVEYASDPAAIKHGKTRRATLTAELIGTYDSLMAWVTDYSLPVQGAYTRLLGMMDIVNETQDEPSSQLALMPVGKVENYAGRRVRALDAMRQASSVMTMPIREAGPYLFEVVDTADEPFLPGTITLADVENLYSALTIDWTRRPKTIAVIGTAPIIDG